MTARLIVREHRISGEGGTYLHYELRYAEHGPHTPNGSTLVAQIHPIGERGKQLAERLRDAFNAAADEGAAV